MTALAVDHSPTTIDPATYRRVLGQFATGVAVVTGSDQGRPAGLTVNSFSSVSLDPPLVGFYAGARSTTWPRIAPSGRFCVNVLAEHQEDVGKAFAAPKADRYGRVRWNWSDGGCPVLDDVAAWIECRTEMVVPAGDHLLVLGRVQALAAAHARPLIVLHGRYRRLAS